ncbi:MAG TPA: TonB-dependent receptor [Gammaproteobacteria bacterium]|nr:TonB-dependent receptor [Gammaproteobacteria bacterium]
MLQRSEALLFCAFVFLPAASRAEEPESLAPVVVSATRSSEYSVTTPANICIIDRTEIETSGVTNLADLLRGHAGIQISDLFGDGSRPTVSMRGFGGNAQANTLILVDGRRLNNADLGNPDLNTIPLEDIERIEIVEGSGGTLFGDQAVAGVINIITRAPRKLRARAAVQAGSYDHHDESIMVEDRHDNGIGYRFSGVKRDNDNYRRSNDSDFDSLSGKLDYRGAQGGAFLEYQSIFENLQTPGALFLDQIAVDRKQPLNPGDFIKTRTDAARAGFNFDLAHGWEAQAELTNRYSGASGVLSVGGVGGPVLTKRHHQEFTPRIYHRWDTGDGEALLTIGADVYATRFFLNSILGTIDDKQNQYSGYARLIYPLNRDLSLTVGHRQARVTNDITGALLPPHTGIDDDGGASELGLSYQYSPALRLFGRVETNYRFVLADEYTSASFGGEIPTAQKGRSAEFGGAWEGRAVAASVTGYVLDLKNEIDFDPVKFINTNIGGTRRVGVIAEARYTPYAPLTFSMHYGFVDAGITDGPSAGLDVPFVAAHTGSVGAEYRLPHNFTAYLDVYGISDRTAVGDFAGTLPGAPGYVIGNFNLGWRWRGLEVNMRINNLLDKDYSDNAQTGFRAPLFITETARFPSPGRNFLVTVGYTYD